MSLFNGKKLIQEGDIVIIYNSHADISFIKIKKGEIYTNKVGEFPAESFIGAPFGSRVTTQNAYTHQVISKNKSGKSTCTLKSTKYIVALEPTPELWTKCLDHRTQITYDLDNSLVIFNLHLVPGNVVVESGTGSGSLSMFLARAVSKKGHVYTHEYNLDRFNHATRDFHDHGLDDVVTCVHRNVYEDGFLEELQGKADAVFLDLPMPWLAIDHSVRVLKPFGRVCTFSPCIEQVQKTVQYLSNRGFSHIQTVECLLKEYRSTKAKKIVPGCLVEIEADEMEVEATNEEMSQDSVSFCSDGNIVFPKHLQFPPKPKSCVTDIQSVLPFDIMPGHTGYLTFAYAPL